MHALRRLCDARLVCVCVVYDVVEQALGTSSPVWLQACVLDYWYSQRVSRQQNPILEDAKRI